MAFLTNEVKKVQQSIDFLEGAVTRAYDAGNTEKAEKQAGKLPGEYERLNKTKSDLEDAVAWLADINDRKKRA